jgi:hypothetical protein
VGELRLKVELAGRLEDGAVRAKASEANEALLAFEDDVLSVAPVGMKTGVVDLVDAEALEAGSQHQQEGSGASRRFSGGRSSRDTTSRRALPGPRSNRPDGDPLVKSEHGAFHGSLDSLFSKIRLCRCAQSWGDLEVHAMRVATSADALPAKTSLAIALGGTKRCGPPLRSSAERNVGRALAANCRAP